MDIVAFEQLLDDPIDWRYKGFPVADPPATPRTIAAKGWNILRGDVPLPLLAIREDAVAPGSFEENVANYVANAERHRAELRRLT